MLIIMNPATEEVVRTLEEDTASSIAEKVGAARAAQRRWARTSLAERLDVLRRFQADLAAQRDDLAAILTQETGKPITQAKNEINATGPRVQFFLDHVEAVVRPEVVHEAAGLSERISYEPLGVIANISAWNYPYFVGTNVFVPALLTGNAVLYKPSEHATLTGLALARLLHGAGLPREVFAPVVGGGAVGAALLAHAIDGVFFTGSYPTGVKIASAAARHLMKVQLELGGKDPVYVCDDVDAAAAAAALADGAFYNTGQSCCAVERIYVHEASYNAFVESFVGEVRKLVAGEPTDPATTLGPLTRPAQLAVLEAQVRDATGKGAKVLCGGARAARRGAYFEPTVLVNVDHTMAVMQDESFGPIIGIQAVRDDADAVALMNDTAYGLTAGVYSRDEARAREILAQVDSGSVYWNCCDRVSPRLPWTGRRHSGIGSTLSEHGIRAFLQPKAWHWRQP
ncbi:MAG TPA: aldehyde dehydrogenase family protein [Myxococcota bacterium]|nr:aldehyde dehydrogenase family protein [Myxococcota bacterium]